MKVALRVGNQAPNSSHRKLLWSKATAVKGCVVRAGRRGYAVRIFSISEIITALDVRAALEGMAACLITERGVPQLMVRTLRGCLDEGDRLFAKPQFDSGDEVVYGQINERLHSAIIVAADNTMISDLVARLHRVPFVAPGTLRSTRRAPIKFTISCCGRAGSTGRSRKLSMIARALPSS
jgi:GntR family transcriptional regulator of vanillate catabolism